MMAGMSRLGSRKRIRFCWATIRRWVHMSGNPLKSAVIAAPSKITGFLPQPVPVPRKSAPIAYRAITLKDTQ